MTEIREPNFELDLPGDWEEVESPEPATYAYRDTAGDESVTVTLLAVRPMYAIADPARLLDDYLHHRSKFEQGQNPDLEQTEPVSVQQDGTFEGHWDAADVAGGRRSRHRVILVGSMLADFFYEAAGLDEAVFGVKADALLGSARATAE